MIDYSELKRLAEAALNDNGDYVALNDYGMAVPPAVVLDLIAEVEALRKDRTDWQAECLKRGFEYVREPDDHYVLADLPEMADLLGVLLGVEVRSKENDSYGETVSALQDAADANSDAFHRAYEAEKECKELRKALVNVRESIQREYWDEYAGMEETREILDLAISKGERP